MRWSNQIIVLVIATVITMSCTSPDEVMEESVDAYRSYIAASGFDPARQYCNPVIPGFNPDPCIIRVEDDYYIATSTFEWFPGIPIYHSKDLVNWTLEHHALTSHSQADLRGIASSAGIFAPSIHHHNGTFYVLYTVFSGQFPFNATPNYIISAPRLEGPWTEPVYINSTGFDPSLFIDDDGKCYYMNMLLDFHQPHITGGITMQEFSLENLQLRSDAVNIFKGSCHGTEGPRIYKHGEYYYLITAEGGTDWNHQVSVARSKNVYGPYELDPENPMLTAKNDPDYPVQRAGHASLVETQNGEWYMSYLASRPLMQSKKSVLGRETFLEKVEWTEQDWLRLSSGDTKPGIVLDLPSLEQQAKQEEVCRDDFNSLSISPKYLSLRQAFNNSWVSLDKEAGYMAIRGRRPFNALNDQSIVSQRLTSYYGYAETCLKFNPESYRQMAGLTVFYDTRDFAYLKVSYSDSLGKYLSIMHQNGGGQNSELDEKLAVNGSEDIYLRVDFNFDSLQFSYSLDGNEFKTIGNPFASAQFSDENDKYGFTGCTVGICAHDMVYENKWAYFDYFEYNDE